MYFVYLLECKDGTIYTGITTDMVRRFGEHKSGKGAHYTALHGAKRILYTEKHPDRSSATRREAEIKKWRRKNKLALASKS